MRFPSPTEDPMAITPELHSDLDFSELRLRFDAHFATAGDVSDSVYVGFISDPADPATFTLIERFGLERDAINFMVDLSVHEEGDGRRIAFMAKRGGSWNSHYYGNVLIENINDPLVIGPFALLSPPDETELLVEGDPESEVVIMWEEADLNYDGNVRYTWHLDLREGDFSDPVVSIPADIEGTATQITLTLGAIDALLEENNLNVGDILEADWTVTAEFADLVEFADAAFAIDLERGVVQEEPEISTFALLTPEDGTELLVEGDPEDEVVITWERPESNVDEDLVFTWHLDVRDGEFDPPVVSIPADDDGNANQITLTLGAIDDLLDANGLDVGDVLAADWTVTAEFDDVVQFADAAFAIDLERGVLGELFTVTFNVDMSFADDFDPDVYDVFISGEMVSWATPGSNPDARMEPVIEGSDIYTITFRLEAGDYAYKYFLVEEGGDPSWDDGEWPGDPNRVISVSEDTEVLDFFGFQEPPTLAGSYFIPQGEHDQGFADLALAIEALNLRGVSDAVTWYITDDLDHSDEPLPWIERGDLTEETPLIIKPAPDTDVTVSFTGGYGIAIDNTGWVTIDGDNGADGQMTFLMAQVGGAGSGLISITENAQHIAVRNLNLQHEHGGGQAIRIRQAFSGTGSVSPNGVVVENNTIGTHENTFADGLAIWGSAAIPVQNVTVADNLIYAGRRGITTFYVEENTYSGNEMYVTGQVASNAWHGGIYLAGGVGEINIHGNRILEVAVNGTGYAGAILLNGSSDAVNVYNNYLSMNVPNMGESEANNIYGIVINFPNAGNPLNIVHNTIYLPETGLTGGVHAGFGWERDSNEMTDNVHFVNNIVVNENDLDTAYGIEWPWDTGFGMSEFNNIYVPDGNAGLWDEEVAADLSAWQMATGLDANSVVTAVEFESNTDLTLVGSSIGDNTLASLPVELVTTDIFGNLRGDFPYMGAFEGDVALVLARIAIMPPPDDDRLALQPFPFEFNMDTDEVNWLEPTFFPFSNAQLARIENPDKSGLNESDYVLEYTKPEGADAWAGFFYRLDNPVQLTDESVFKMKLWAPKADFNAIMKLELVAGGGMPDQIVEVTQSGEWVEVEWDLSEVDRDTPWDMVTIIMDMDVNPVPTTETWYMDDFRLEGVEVAVVPLAGNYFIPQGDHDQGFADLSEAIAELNERGASAPVTWYITDDLDHSDAELPWIERDGMTEETPLTIKPAPETDVTVSFTGAYGIAIDNTSWVTIDGHNEGGQMTFLMTQEGGAGSGLISITEDAQHIAVRNLNLQHEHGGGQAFRIRQAFSGTGSVSPNGVVVENNTIGTHENTFADGLAIWGSAAIPVQNVTVADNLIYAGRRGITTFYVEENTYRDNEMYVTGQVASDIWHGAIYLAGGVGEINIHGNRILEVAVNGNGYSGAILLNGSDNDVNVYNNFIAMNVPNMGESEANNIYGIVINFPNAGNPLNIVHNTIYLPETGLTGGIHAGFGWERDSNEMTDNVHFVNNIVVNENDLDVAYGIEWPWDTGFGMSDFNNIYVPNGNAGFWNDAAAADLNEWRSATGQDAHSVTADVEFESNTDLTLVGNSVGDNRLAGTPVEMVTTDIFGNERNEEYPYMGAFEGDVPLERETTDVEVDQPYVFSLDQNYPNPFNPSTNIQFTLPETMEVRLDVYDVTGRHVRTLVNEQREAGMHTVVFDGSQLASGVYVYRIIAGQHVETRKMTFIK